MRKHIKAKEFGGSRKDMDGPSLKKDKKKIKEIKKQ